MISAANTASTSLLFGLQNDRSGDAVRTILETVRAAKGSEGASGSGPDVIINIDGSPATDAQRAKFAGLEEMATEAEAIGRVATKERAELAAAQAKIDAELGFEQQMTGRLKAAHAHHAAQPTGEFDFRNREDALRDALSHAGTITSRVRDVGYGARSVAGTENVLADGDLSSADREMYEQRLARREDSATADRVRADIAADRLRQSFGLTAPTHVHEADGSATQLAFEVRHSKFGLLLSVDENGIKTSYDAEGNASHVNGQPLDMTV